MKVIAYTLKRLFGILLSSLILVLASLSQLLTINILLSTHLQLPHGLQHPKQDIIKSTPSSIFLAGV